MMRSNNLSLSSQSRSLAMAFAATSASLLSIAFVSAIFRPRREVAILGEDIEIITQQTERNRRILSSADDLLSEPHGFGNNHFASMLAQLRPSPFRGQWGKLARRYTISITTPAGCDIEVEYVEPCDLDPNSTYSSSIPTVIVLHGINGHSTEPYVEQAALHIAVEKRWRAIVLNYAKVKAVYTGTRGAALGGQSLIDAADVNFLISHIRKRHDGFLAAVGFSMGGSKLVQYLCRTKEHCQLDAACTISSPLDFTERNYTVHRPVEMVHRLYHFVIASSVKLALARNYFELRKHPRLSETKPFRRSTSSLMWWLQANTVTEIDRTLTMPSKGYSDLDHYYNDATYIHQLRDSITMPFLCLTAKNDPFVPEHIIPGHDVAADNENIFIVNTPRVGGHIGFWLPGRGCWATKACLSFFDSVRQNITMTPRSRMLRKASSLKAAHYLERTSSMGLTNYFGLVAHDSDYSFFSGEYDDPATIPTGSHGDLTKCTSQSMLHAFGKGDNKVEGTRTAAAATAAHNQLVHQFNSFVF